MMEEIQYTYPLTHEVRDFLSANGYACYDRISDEALVANRFTGTGNMVAIGSSDTIVVKNGKWLRKEGSLIIIVNKPSGDFKAMANEKSTEKYEGAT